MFRSLVESSTSLLITLSCPAATEKTRRVVWTTIGGLPLESEVAVDLLLPVEEAAEDVEADHEAFRDLDLRRIEGDPETEDVVDLLPEEDPEDAREVSADPEAALPHLA